MPGCSLATGCHSSTSLARGVTARPLNLANETLARREGAAPIFHSVHIDDVVQECHGFKDDVFQSIAESGGCFISAVQAMDLEISSKSVILSSSKPLQSSLIHFFRHSYGVDLQPAGSAPHLGFSRSSGKTNTVKPFTLLKRRFSKANLRAIRGAWLARKSAKALSLFTTGVVPIATYGADHLGLTKSLRRQLDSMAIRAAGDPGFQACSTTLLHIKLGHRPSDIVMHKVVANFTAFWNTLQHEERSRINEAWDKVRR